MNLDDLTVNFVHLNRKLLLSDWEWLIGKKLPILLTAGGNAFVQDASDNSIYFFDVDLGSLTIVAKNIEEFRLFLQKPDFVANYFSVQMVGDLIQSGLTLPKGKIYSFKVLPMLGGKLELSNVEISDIEVHFSITGQIHKQCKNLPYGTSINKVELRLPANTKKWWQFR